MTAVTAKLIRFFIIWLIVVNNGVFDPLNTIFLLILGGKVLVEI